VAASVELGLIAPGDAGAIAEERGAPGGDLAASDWKPRRQPSTEVTPAYLSHRFGDDPQRVHLIVNNSRRFEIGALIYLNTTPPDPAQAIGVIVEEAAVGGVALMARSALGEGSRFVIETYAGPSPARMARAG
jgi:hypothetical protein